MVTPQVCAKIEFARRALSALNVSPAAAAPVPSVARGSVTQLPGVVRVPTHRRTRRCDCARVIDPSVTNRNVVFPRICFGVVDMQLDGSELAVRVVAPT